MKVIVHGGYTYETTLDVEVGDEVLLPDSGLGQWVGAVTQIGSSYDGPCLRVLGLYRRAAEAAAADERRVAAKRRYRVGEKITYHDGREGTVEEVNREDRPTCVRINNGRYPEPETRSYGSAAAFYDDVAEA